MHGGYTRMYTVFITHSHTLQMHINFDTHFSLKTWYQPCFKVAHGKEEEQGNFVSILAHSVGQLSKICTNVK